IMATAALSVSRHLAGVRPAKGLFLIFTLLALVSVTNSLIDKNYLKIIQEYYEGGLEDAADKKKDFENQLKVASDIFEEDLEKFHPMLDQVKAATSNSLMLEGFSSDITNILVKQRKDFAKGKKAHQREIEDIWNFVKSQEHGED
ncbi:hypothetical protein GOODEAATRI_012210, partial [Goodea atripinnis]